MQRLYKTLGSTELRTSTGRDHAEQWTVFVQTLDPEVFDLFTPLEPFTHIGILRIAPILQLLVVSFP